MKIAESLSVRTPNPNLRETIGPGSELGLPVALVTVMNHSKQFSFNDPRLRKMNAYGGELRRQKKNRHARPLSSRHPIHLILKSTRAKGRLSFLRPHNRKILQRTLAQLSGRFGIRILEIGIAGNHFHLLVKFQNRRLFIHFLKAFTGTLAKRIRGPQKQTESFFDFRPFTRVVESFRGYKVARDYVILNQLEGLGILPYRHQRTRRREPDRWSTN